MSLPITIPKIIPPSDNVFFERKINGRFNKYELNDIRIQIKKGGHVGFTIEDKTGEYIPITPKGRIYPYPDYMDLIVKQLCQL